jgi:hypothetical protein
LDPKLIEQYERMRVELVVAGALGDEAHDALVDERDRHRPAAQATTR